MFDLVTAFKITDFFSNDHMVTTLSTLPRDEEDWVMQRFAVSYWAAAGSIILTGKNRIETFLMAVQTGRWEQKSSIPELTVARTSHASMTLGRQCYVACGEGNRGYLRSVEMLRMGAQAWVLIDIPDVTPRCNPVFSQIDTNNIVILGGRYGG